MNKERVREYLARSLFETIKPMNDTSPETLNEMCSVAVQAALQAGDLLRKMWAEPLQISKKGFRDLVTNADHASQALIVDTIRSCFPQHGFLAEEADSALKATGPFLWIIDPVDGTTNYSRHLPNYCISIAAIKQPANETAHDEPEIVLGVIYDPIREELFQATAAQGAFLNGTKIQVSSTEHLDEAIIALDWSHQQGQRQTTLEMVQKIAHYVNTLRAIGSAALTLAWVAAGRLDSYFNLNLKAWDVAAGKLLITEAGGQLTTIDNRPWRLTDTGCIAGNGRIVPELRERLQITFDKKTHP